MLGQRGLHDPKCSQLTNQVRAREVEIQSEGSMHAFVALALHEPQNKRLSLFVTPASRPLPAAPLSILHGHLAVRAQAMAFSILLHVATGLEYLHGLGIIHGGAPEPPLALGCSCALRLGAVVLFGQHLAHRCACPQT